MTDPEIIEMLRDEVRRLGVGGEAVEHYTAGLFAGLVLGGHVPIDRRGCTALVGVIVRNERIKASE